MRVEQPRLHCQSCRTEVHGGVKPGRRDECPGCGAELHTCLNCAFYEPTFTRGCREPAAEEVRDRQRANFCGWFSFRVGLPEQGGDEQKARAAFDALFGGPKEPEEKNDAAKAFDALFRK